ncbi:choice-of-anchor U domain-containing protein [Halochromatium sp.]
MFLENASASQFNWGTPTNLSSTEHSAWTPQVAVDSSGNAIAVWQRLNSPRIIQSARYDAGSGDWSEVSDLSATSNAQDPQVAVDSSGNAIAVWRQSSDFIIIQSARYDAGSGEWGEVSDLSAIDSVAEVPQVAVDSSGNAIAVWRQSSDFIVQSARYEVGTGWVEKDDAIEVSDLSPSDLNADVPQVAIDSLGNAIAVWETSGSKVVIQSKRYDADEGEWSDVSDLSDAGLTAYNPQVAVDHSGNAIAVWRSSNGTNSIIQSARYDATSGEWSSVSDISTAGSAFEPQVAVDSSGNAIAVWWQSSGVIIQSARYDADEDQWSDVSDISAGSAYEPQVAVDSSGNAIAVWRNAGDKKIQSARYDVYGDQWSEYSDISGADQVSQYPQIAMDRSGNAIAVWPGDISDARVIRSARGITTYSIGGNLSGLASGQSVVLRNNSGDDKTLSANGAFTFDTNIASGDSYAVTVLTKPTGQTCTVSNGSGTATADVTDVAVTCTTNTYSITATANPSAGGTVSCSPNPVDYDASTSCSAWANTGYSFTSWADACAGQSGTSCTLDNVTAAATVTANFSLNPIDGQCGSANGATFDSAPSSGLCSSGNAGAVAGSGPWFWNCPGRNGGSTSACVAYARGIPPDDDWSKLPDDDHDVVPNVVEALVTGPNGQAGDGNGDGTPDGEQPHVASFPGAACPERPTPRFVTLQAPTGTAIEALTRRDPPADLPADITLSCGEISFVVDHLTPGQTLAFSVFVENDVPVDGYYYRNLQTGAWDNIATAPVAVGTKTRLDYSLREGGPYDGDGNTNGELVDPGGPGRRNGAPPAAMAIPTLSLPALGALAGLMVWLAGWQRHRTARR